MANNRELSQLASFVTVNDTSKTIAFGSTVASLNVAGVVTATTFVGDLNGNITGSSAGVNVTGVGTIARLEATNINVSGASTVGVVTALDIQNANVTNTFIGNQASVLSGRVGTGLSQSFNTIIGYQAGNSISVGGTFTSNTFIGHKSGYGSSDGYNNTGVGGSSLTNLTTGLQNSAFGESALRSLTTGNNNTGIGRSAGSELTSGDYNVFLGAFAGSGNTTGDRNVVIGEASGRGSGSSNVVIGMSAFRAGSGSYNVAIGQEALICSGGKPDTTTGVANNVMVGYRVGYAATSNAASNTGVGYEALRLLKDGTFNTTLGRNAGYGITSGSNNLALGYNAGNDAVWDFSASVGAGASSNVIVVGNNNHDTAYIKIDWTVTSDERDKEIEGPVPHGLAFVQALEPIKFQFKDRESGEVTDSKFRYGFSAQQVAELEGNPTVIANTVDPENLKVTSAHLVPVLVNAIKELSAKVAELEARLDAQ